MVSILDQLGKRDRPKAANPVRVNVGSELLYQVQWRPVLLPAVLPFAVEKGLIGGGFGARLRSSKARRPPCSYRLTHLWTVFRVVR